MILSCDQYKSENYVFAFQNVITAKNWAIFRVTAVSVYRYFTTAAWWAVAGGSPGKCNIMIY